MVYQGFAVKELPPMSEALLLQTGPKLNEGQPRSSDGRTRASIGEAKAALWRALAEDLIQVTATEIETKRTVTLPAYAWSDLVWDHDYGENILLPGGTGAQGFRD